MYSDNSSKTADGLTLTGWHYLTGVATQASGATRLRVFRPYLSQFEASSTAAVEWFKRHL